MKYKRHGIENKLSFGSYPEVSLRDARKLREVSPRARTPF
jgi:hypothetical protein